MTLFKLKTAEEKENDAKKMAYVASVIQMKKIDELTDLCGCLPADGEIYFLEAKKSFSAFTFVPYLLMHAGDIEDLFIATYGINMKVLDSLQDALEQRKIHQCEIYISDSIRTRMPAVYDRMQAMSLTLPLKVSYGWTHKKVTTAKIGTRHYVIEGSGNYSDNTTAEQYVFAENKELYDFRRTI